MWKCTKCGTDNWDTAMVCHRCEPAKYREQEGRTQTDDFGFFDRILHLFGLSKLESEYRSLQKENCELAAKVEEFEIEEAIKENAEFERWRAKTKKLEEEKEESERSTSVRL